MRPRAIPLALALATLAPAAPALAQLHITPTAGAYHPGEAPMDLGDSGVRLFRGRALGLGMNIEAGILRGTIAYASGATITGDGAEGDLGEGTLLAMTAGVALRPLPRLLGLQPYALLGGGVKRFGYSWNDSRFNDVLPSNEREFVFQYGAGADLMLGGLGLIAEVYDMVAPELDDSRRHDTFLQLGLRFRLGGN